MSLFYCSPKVNEDMYDFANSGVETIFHVKGTVSREGAPPVSMTPVANFSTATAGVFDTCGKFTTGVE